MPVQRSASRVAIATAKKSLTQDENVNPSTTRMGVSASASATNNAALNMTINDVTCPICLEIFIEPISLPCNHELCLQCFNSMTNFETFECPMCRARLATWARTARVQNQKLVNEKRWSEIKKTFPSEVKNKIEGKSGQIVKESLDKLRQGIIDSTNRVGQKCAQPGEIRQEYLDYLKREEERIRKEKEAEEKESIEYIQKLIRQEENVSFDDYMFMLNTINRPASSASSTSIRVISGASTPDNLQPAHSTSSSMAAASSTSVHTQQSMPTSGASTSAMAHQIADNATPVTIRDANVGSSSQPNHSSSTAQPQSQPSRINDQNKKTLPKRPAEGDDSSGEEEPTNSNATSTSTSAPSISRPITRSRHEITPSTSENANDNQNEVKLTASARLLRRNSSRRATAATSSSSTAPAQTVISKSAEHTLNTYATLQRANKKSKLARITEVADKKNSSLNLTSASHVNNQSQLSTSTTSVMSIDEEEFRRNLRPRANKQTHL